MATVDGVPIRGPEVARRAVVDGIPLRAALQRLIDEQLLFAEAKRRGLHRAPDISAESKRLAVYALLRNTFERDFTPAQVDRALIDRVYRKEKQRRFDRPELRRFSHIMVRRPWRRRAGRWTIDPKLDARARAVARAILARATAAAPKTWRAFESLKAEVPHRGFEVESERGTVARFQLRKSFGDQLFEQANPGVIAAVIRTRPAWHVAFLIEVQPPLKVPPTRAQAIIREKVFPYARQRAFTSYLDRAKQRCTIRRYPENLPVGPGEIRRPGPEPRR